MIKTAVIGASGYIGQHLWKKYRETIPDGIGTGFSQLKQDLISFDLRNPNLASLKLLDTGHESVLIASAKPNVGWCEAYPKESYDLNVKGTLAFIEQLAKHSLHVLFLSSDYVFNGIEGNYTDNAPASPVTEYGRQKAEVEKQIPNLTDNYTILRLSKIYGTTWKDNTLIDGLAADLIANKKITVATDQFFSPTHVDDVARMIFYVQEQNIKGLVNLCHANIYSRYQIAAMLAKALNISASLLEPVALHAISGMENRPLNTSLVPSRSLNSIQPSLFSMNQAIECIVANWKECTSTS